MSFASDIAFICIRKKNQRLGEPAHMFQFSIAKIVQYIMEYGFKQTFQLSIGPACLSSCTCVNLASEAKPFKGFSTLTMSALLNIEAPWITPVRHALDFQYTLCLSIDVMRRHWWHPFLTPYTVDSSNTSVQCLTLSGQRLQKQEFDISNWFVQSGYSWWYC